MKLSNNRPGFSLMMMVIIMSGIFALAVATMVFSKKAMDIANQSQTTKRMITIRGAVAKAYLADPDGGFPAPAGTGVPVEIQDLGLTREYRLDAWGQALEYYRAPIVGGTTFPPGIPDITGVLVDGVPAGGYLLSFGSDQVRQTPSLGGTPPAIDRGGDDILIPLNVQAEALAVSLRELQALAQKQCAYHKTKDPEEWYSWAASSLGSGTPPDPLVFVRDYGLSEVLVTDPWGVLYDWVYDGLDNSGYFRSAGPDRTLGTSDDLHSPVLTVALCPVPISGLPTPLAKWEFNEDPDATTMSPGATLVNYTAGSLGWIDETPGPNDGSNGAYDFNGTDYFITEFNPLTELGDASGKARPFTVVFWAQPDTDVTSNQIVVGSGDWSVSGGRRFYVGLINGNWYWGLGNQWDGATAVTSFDLYWQYIAYVYDGTDIVIFRNGREEYRQAYTGDGLLPDLNIDIGAIRRNNTSGDTNYLGKADDVAIYDRALTTANIKQLYDEAAVGRYLLDGDTEDASPNQQPGTAHGTEIYVNGHNGTDHALYFDGTNQFVSIPYHPSWDFRYAFTISAWVKAPANNDYKVVFCKQFSPSNRNFWLALAPSTSGPWGVRETLLKFSSGGNTNYCDLRVPPDLKTDTWRHVVGVYDGLRGEAYIYRDGTRGAPTKTGLGGPLGGMGADLLLGAGTYSDTRKFLGAMDDVVIFTRALHDTEIVQLFNE